MTMLHSHMAGLVRNLCGGEQQSLNLLDQHIGIARLDDDAVEAGIAGLVELPGMGIASRGNKWNALGVGVGAQVPGYLDS